MGSPEGSKPGVSVHSLIPLQMGMYVYGVSRAVMERGMVGAAQGKTVSLAMCLSHLGSPHFVTFSLGHGGAEVTPASHAQQHPIP